MSCGLFVFCFGFVMFTVLELGEGEETCFCYQRLKCFLVILLFLDGNGIRNANMFSLNMLKA